MRLFYIQLALMASMIWGLHVLGPGPEQPSAATAQVVEFLHPEPKVAWMRAPAWRGEPLTAQDKMLPHDLEVYERLAAAGSPVAAEIWTLGDPIIEQVRPPGPRERSDIVVVERLGLRMTDHERAGIAAIAHIESHSQFRPMVSVLLTEPGQVEALGRLPFVYFIEIYPAVEVQFDGVAMASRH